MVFCGQCGLQLAPGDSACPRCGAVTELDLPFEDPHTNDPTIASPAAPGSVSPWRDGYDQNNTLATQEQQQQRPFTPPQQPKLVLRPGGVDYNVDVQGTNEATRSVNAPRPAPSSNPNMGTAYPGYAPQSGVGYQPVAGQYGYAEPISQAPTRSGKGRNAALLAILLVLLLLLAAATTFTLKLNGVIGGHTPSPTPTSTLTAVQQATNVVQQYFADINNHDYQSAYNLLGSDFQNQQPYSQFAAGYAHTQHDDVTIDKTTLLADGSVQVDITIHAQEDSGTSTYQGSDIVGQQNGAWKILSGTLTKIG